MSEEDCIAQDLHFYETESERLTLGPKHVKIYSTVSHCIGLML